MKVALKGDSVAAFSTPLLTVFAVDKATGGKDGKDGKKSAPAVLTQEKAIAKALDGVLGTGEFKAGSLETLLVHKPAGLAAERLLVVGLGKEAKATVHDARKAAGTAVRFAKTKNVRDVAIVLPDASAGLPAAATAQAVTEGALVGDFDSDTYKSDREDKALGTVTLLGAAAKDAAVKAAVETGTVLGESQNFARELVNEPGNKLTPTIFGDRVARMSRKVGLECEVYGAKKIKDLGMGAFWSVAQGSDEPPALMVMTYTPKKAKKNSPVLGLVGKGITFDTGGISLKPADGMEKMKYDMAGGAAMAGAMRAIALLKPDVKVIGIICATENMPSGKAQKPGDVQTAMSGKTIEIMNTDAEGRLVLADGLHYAKQLGATHLIDAATLTGAVVVALGMVNAGMFTNDDAALEQFKAALKVTGEKFWQLPAEDEYREHIKSSIADIMNTGDSRWGGAITAAMFLKEFAGDTPWIHLDIAGMAWVESAKPWIAKGPSGIAVRSIFEWVKSYA